MKHAIKILQNARDEAIKNEPIHRAAGQPKLARMDRDLAWDCLDAITVLQVVTVERKLAAKKGGQP
jgi:hypothetical protein